MSRTVKEWIAKTDDSAIPPRVKDRVLKRCGERCQDCGKPLSGRERPEFDHIKSLINEGEHREANLQALCGPCHGAKTKVDVAEKSTVASKRAKHFGLRGKNRTIPGRKFDGTPIPARWVNT